MSIFREPIFKDLPTRKGDFELCLLCVIVVEENAAQGLIFIDLALNTLDVSLRDICCLLLFSILICYRLERVKWLVGLGVW